MAQPVIRSSPTAGVLSSRLSHTMWVSRWTKRSLGRLFSRFLPFSPATDFSPPFLQNHLIHFVSYHFIHPVMVRQAWSVGILAIHRPSSIVIASHPSIRPCAGHKLRILFVNIYYIILKSGIFIFTPTNTNTRARTHTHTHTRTHAHTHTHTHYI